MGEWADDGWFCLVSPGTDPSEHQQFRTVSACSAVLCVLCAPRALALSVGLSLFPTVIRYACPRKHFTL